MKWLPLPVSVARVVPYFSHLQLPLGLSIKSPHWNFMAVEWRHAQMRSLKFNPQCDSDKQTISCASSLGAVYGMSAVMSISLRYFVIIFACQWPLKCKMYVGITIIEFERGWQSRMVNTKAFYVLFLFKWILVEKRESFREFYRGHFYLCNPRLP